MAKRATHSDVCIGIDVGGTFTDAVLTDGRSIWRAKSPTTPDDLSAGVLAACSLAAKEAGKSLEQLIPTVRRFGLGTTAVTNVLASRTGARIGLITTKGFEDQIPLAKGRRINDGSWVAYPAQVVPRRRIIGVRERLDREGRELEPIDLDEVITAGRHLVEREHVEAIAVSFLWAFKNSQHEDLAAAALREQFPALPIMSGAALNPIIREFERTTFALLNAYTVDGFRGIDALADELARLGLSVPLLLVHSGGGSITVAEARRVPIGLAASGPAAGVAASASLAQASGLSDVLTCDMGGTSFDVAVVTNGQPSRRTRGELMGIWTSLPLVDVESIGAGGGSIAWVDARGMLRVGPRSAGAVPGPACYGKGGSDPTVTDALLVLGYLDPGRFLGGQMELDPDAARRACEALGRDVGLDALETAWGIREIALEGMVKAVRSLLNARGLDPRTHAIVSYGGCGALFTAEIARAIGAGSVLIPELASVFSAFGAATADIRRERLNSVVMQMPIDAQALEVLAEKLRAEVLEDLAADGIPEADRSVVYEADLRFKRQVWEISIPLPPGPITVRSISRLIDDFRSEYAKRYGQGSIMLGAPIELVTFRAVGIGRTVKATLRSRRQERVEEGTPPPTHSTRLVEIARGEKGSKKVRVYDGADLRPGHQVRGPAIVDERDTTIWVPPRAALRVDASGTLLVEVA